MSMPSTIIPPAPPLLSSTSLPVVRKHSHAQPGSLDDDDVWLTGNRRYLGYADEIGEALDHVDAINRLSGHKTYSLKPIFTDRGLSASTGYGISLVYCLLNFYSRARQGWQKSKDAGFSNRQSAQKVASDLGGLALFHYFATMKLAPSFINMIGKGIRKSMMTADGNITLKKAALDGQHTPITPEMFRPQLVKPLARLAKISPEKAAKLLKKAYIPLQVGTAIGLIPLISHPFDKAIQTALDYTYRPLLGLNRFERDPSKWYRLTSRPKPEFWGTSRHLAGPASPKVGLLEKPPLFHALFG